MPAITGETAMIDNKVWWQSKTIWANVLTALVAILLLVSQSPSLTLYSEWLLLAQGVLNIVLRVLTDTTIRR